MIDVFDDARGTPGIWLVILIFVVLALAWNVVIPVYEAPDEPDHAQFVDFFLGHSNLPDSRTDLGVAGVESTQGPLYYVLSAAALRLAGVTGFYVKPAENPRFTFSPTNPERNRFVARTSGDELAVRVARLASIVGGIITVAATFALGRALTAQSDAAVVAASLVAFLPQFTFVASVVSNDSLAAASGALLLCVSVWMSQSAVGTTRHDALLGFVTGLAVLTKISLLAFVPVGALALFQPSRRSRAGIIRSGLVYGCAFVLGGGWFLLRNLYLYGDLLDSRARAVIGANQAYPLDELGFYFVYVFPQMVSRSFVGVFGWMNVFLPEPAYLLFDGLWFVAFVGIWYTAWKGHGASHRSWLILIVALVLMGLSLVAWNFGYIAFQGRLLFPVLAAIAVLLARGWAAFPPPFRSVLFVSVVLGLLVLNLFSLYVVYSAYR